MAILFCCYLVSVCLLLSSTRKIRKKDEKKIENVTSPKRFVAADTAPPEPL